MINMGLDIKGWVKITDKTSGEILVDKSNAIHYENFSEALAKSICSGPLNANDSENPSGFIKTMVFGNGGTDVSPTGVITYKTPNYTGSSATLYNETYGSGSNTILPKYINQQFSVNPDPINNNLTINHLPGKAYSDILVSCLLNYGEPSDGLAFDNTTDFNSSYVFDELGLKSAGGKLLTHVIFHPVQKSLNRLIQIDYTIRIQTLTNLSS
jgi:hypothetical protein